MKKLFYIILLISGIINAQIVNIPDANFKAKLLSAGSENQIAYIDYGTTATFGKIDVNNDGEIQYSEALNVLELHVDSEYPYTIKIHDLTGLEAFTQINKLNFSKNEITSVNLLPFNFLFDLNCSNKRFLVV
jgi:hypothetical protein